MSELMHAEMPYFSHGLIVAFDPAREEMNYGKRSAAGQYEAKLESRL